jgi:hypothetical protein
MPADWAGKQIVLTRGETVLLRAVGGKKFKTILVSQDGVVRLESIDPFLVKMTALEVGLVRLSVVTE